MRRREFITVLGGAAAAWPLAAGAQQDGRVRLVGMLLYGAENDLSAQNRIAGFRRVLQELGWIEGRNLRTEIRVGGSATSLSAQAGELLSLTPEVVVANSRQATVAAQQRTQTVPIVFIGAGDVAANGLVRNIARPEGNITGITNAFNSIAGKWVELLKEAVPRTTRAAALIDLEYSTDESGYMAPIKAAAAIHAVRMTTIAFRNAPEIEPAIAAFAAEPNGALIMTAPVSLRADNVALINRLALRHRLPTIYAGRNAISFDGLMSYGQDNSELWRVGATYVDRILHGAKPGDLPVQYPTKFELVVNLKTAKAIGPTIPETFLVRADEVIE
jgi:ABC-type uncharacterized transport system substrate-binding protein